MRWPGHTGVPGVTPERAERPAGRPTHLGRATPRPQTLPKGHTAERRQRAANRPRNRAEGARAPFPLASRLIGESGNVCAMTKQPAQDEDSPSQLIDAKVEELSDWRGTTLSRLRALIKQADPDVVEEWKWRKPSNPGVPVWSHNGIICTGETYKSVVKLTFFKGASLDDASRLFNSSLDGNTRRAIDFHEGDEIDEKAFVALIRAAVSLNES